MLTTLEYQDRRDPETTNQESPLDQENPAEIVSDDDNNSEEIGRNSN